MDDQDIWLMQSPYFWLRKYDFSRYVIIMFSSVCCYTVYDAIFTLWILMSPLISASFGLKATQIEI